MAVVCAVSLALLGQAIEPVSGRTVPHTRTVSATVSLPSEVPAILAQRNVRAGVRISARRTLLVTLGLPLRHESELNWFIAHRARFGHYLTQSQFTRRFAPTLGQVRRVKLWALNHHMALVYASPDGLVVTVRARARTFESALHVHIRLFRRGRQTFFANVHAPIVPRALDLQTVTGLDNIHHAVYVGGGHLMARRTMARRNAVPASGYKPSQIRAAYDMCIWQTVGGRTTCAPYTVNGKQVDGTGQTIGITGFGQKVDDTDFRAFANDTGEPAITSCAKCSGPDKLQWFLLDGTNSDPSLDEQALDVEYVHGLAMHSHIKYWLGDDGTDPGMEDAIAAAASDKSIHVVSNSWGDPGSESSSNNNPFVKATTNSLKRAVAVGTTFYFSTGDNAADSGCNDPTTHCGLASYPATSPYAVAVGGTNLQMNSAFTSWSSESTWNLSRSDDSGSGGGCAPFFTRPAWQVGVKASTCPGRAIPDISAAGDLGNSPVDVWVYGAAEQVGGTSVSASLIAGMAAVTNRYLTLEHAVNPNVPKSMGFAAPEMYKLATSSYYNTYFHDVLCGSNSFPAGAGWDEATGWGSIDWYAYSEGFAGITPAVTVTPAPSWICNPGSGTGADLVAVACAGKFHCHVAGASGTLLRTWDGWHWNASSPTGRGTISGIACPSRQVCYAVGVNGWLHKSIDGGSTWKSQKLAVSSPRAISCPGLNSCYVVGAGIVKTADGSHFVRQVDPATGNLASVSCWSPTSCDAVRPDGTILQTADGSMWHVQATTLPPGTIASLSCPTATRCTAVGTATTPNAQGGTGLIYSTLDGTVWTSQVVGSNQPLVGVSCSGALRCDAVGSGGEVLRTINATTWNPVAGFGSGELNGVDCPAAGLCFVVGNHGRLNQVGASSGQ
jgi:kumamolisin